MNTFNTKKKTSWRGGGAFFPEGTEKSCFHHEKNNIQANDIQLISLFNLNLIKLAMFLQLGPSCFSAWETPILAYHSQLPNSLKNLINFYYIFGGARFFYWLHLEIVNTASGEFLERSENEKQREKSLTRVTSYQFTAGGTAVFCPSE